MDCLASGKDLGRSVLISGDHAIPEEIEGDPLAFEAPKTKKVPRDLPNFALNPFSVRAFNASYYASHADTTKIEGFEPFFWPLDVVFDWNRIYGARGFVQYQSVFPLETAREGLKTLLEALSSSGRAPFLAVLKQFGAQGQGLLSFPRPGYSLALDLPASAGIEEFAQSLDAITLKFGGRVYLAKDSTLSAASVRQMYPRLGEFLAIKTILDPQHRFQSSLSKRLRIGHSGETA
jgi:FAD/FMN-containing dehydrogenase